MTENRRWTEARLNRRTFLKGLVAAAGLSACDGTTPYDPATAPRKMRGYYSLADTPYFRLQNGRLINTIDNFPAAIDFHVHLGFFVGPRYMNYLATDQRMKYLMDCDAWDGCMFDLDVYLNHMATESQLRAVENGLVSGPLSGRGAGYTHTLPNLLQEMDDMKFDKAVLLPLKLDIIQPDDMEERWINAVDESDTHDRFEIYSSVHVSQDNWLEDLEAAAARGAKGIKFHPTMQTTAPDSLEAMELFHECERLNLDVFFHAGRAGIEPENRQPYAMMENYIAPLEEFKNIQFIFGHSGARDWEEAFQIAKRYPHVWMELAGPSQPWLENMVAEFDNERIIFGSDWPFYPIAASLIKVLHVADGDDTLRDMILSGNARRLLRLDT